MKISTLKLACLASAIMMLGAAGGAQAGAYALSSNNIRDFNIVSTGGITFGTSQDTSKASATLNGSGVATGGAGSSDAPIAIAPGSVLTPAQSTNNAAFPLGLPNAPVGITGSNYSYADAVIEHPIGGGLPFTARTIAESHLATSGTAAGTSDNSSFTGFTSDVVVGGAGGTLDFSFLADPLIRTFLQLNTGIQAQGTLSASLVIRCVTVAGCVANTAVFTWAPNGVLSGPGGVGGTVGGVELADSEDLNTSLSNLNPPGLAQNYSDGIGFLPYRAMTNLLVAGTYSLTLAMSSTDATEKRIPEPGTVGLLGLGLTGLAFAGRRRSKT